MAGALRARGVKEPSAILAAKAGIAVLEVAFERWAEDTKNRKTLERRRCPTWSAGGCACGGRLRQNRMAVRSALACCTLRRCSISRARVSSGQCRATARS